jgi:hypothetical protein
MASNDEHFAIHLTACILGHHQFHLRLHPNCICVFLIFSQVCPMSHSSLVYTLGDLYGHHPSNSSPSAENTGGVKKASPTRG